MFTKKFLVQMECADATRFDFDDARLAQEIEEAAQHIARVASSGTVPRVTVIRDECRCEICAETSQPQPVRG